MLFRKFQNEKGITLVELLAALSLFAVVIALSSTVIVQMMSGAEKANDSISLQQDTNVLMGELRSQFYEGKSELCFNKGEKRITVGDVSIKNGTINDDCIKNIDKDKPLTIKLTTTTDSGADFSVKTTWSLKENYVLEIVTNDTGEFDNKQDFEDLIEEHGDSFVPGKTLIDSNINVCNFDENTRFEEEVMDSYRACDNTVVNANAWFSNNLTLNDVHLTINKNLYAESFFLLHNDATVHTIGSARIDGYLKATGNNKIIVDGYFFADGNVILYNTASILVGKDASFEDDVELQSTTSITINGNAKFLGPVNLHNNAKVIVRGDAQFDGPVGYDWSHGTICVQGDATFDTTVGSNLKIIENATTCN